MNLPTPLPIDGLRRRLSRPFAFALGLALAANAFPSAAQPDSSAGTPLVLEWIGPSDADRTGHGALPVGNGVNDLVLRVDPASLAGGTPIHWSVYASGALTSRMRWEWPESAEPAAGIFVEQSSEGVWLYIEPFLTVAGDVFRVAATFADGSSQTGVVVGEGIAWGDSAKWLGQTASDFVGVAATPSGCKDWAIEVSSPGFDARKAVGWDVWLDYAGVDDYFSDRWTWRANPAEELQGNALVAQASGSSAKLFVEPALAREGDLFAIRAILDDGSTIGWTLAGGGNDWGKTAVYHGRGADDRLGESSAGPNGVADLSLEVFDAGLASGVKRVALRAGGRRWEWPHPGAGVGYLEAKPSGGALRLAFDNPDDRGGEFLFVSAVRNDGTLVGWAVVASKTNLGTDYEWLGQAADVVGAGDAAAEAPQPDGELDLAIRVAHPMLSFNPVARWEVEGAGRFWGPPAEGRASDSQAVVFETDASAGDERTIYFSELAPGRAAEPIRRSTPFTVRAVFADGNVVNWRISSPGSPVLTGARWEGTTRDHYRLSFDNPGALVKEIRADDMEGAVAWTSRAADGSQGDADFDSGAKRVTVSLDRARGTLAPGKTIRIVATDAKGVRRYGTCVAGTVR